MTLFSQINPISQLKINPSHAETSHKHKDANIFENHLNPAMLAFIGKLLLSTLKWVPMCQNFNHFSGFCSFVLTTSATSNIRVKEKMIGSKSSSLHDEEKWIA